MNYLVSVLRGLLASLPIWLAAISAFFASLSALSVYQGEKYRLDFERLKLTYELMHRYADFATRTHTAIACIDALTALDDASISVVLSFEASKIPFGYKPDDQKELLRCMALDNSAVTAGQLAIPVDNVLRRQVLAQLDHMDSLLIAYKYDIGVRPVICENVIGLIKGTTFGDFLERLIKQKHINETAHYSNIFFLVRDLQKSSGCPKYEAPRLERNKVLEFLERLIR